MKQVWIAKAGRPEVLELRTAEDPQPGADEVLIDVVAAGVNFADLIARMGTYPDAPPIPCVIGYEVAGTVRSCGADVSGFEPGARVFALTRFGGYSSVVSIPHRQVFVMPEEMSFLEGAAIPVNYFTAYLALFLMGNLQGGQRCLIQGAGGGVGIAAVQLARWAGAEVFGTASKQKHELISSVGVHHPIDYRNRDFAEEVLRITGGSGVHLVLDSIGGRTAREGYGLLAPLGKLVCFGISSSVRGGTRSILGLVRAVLPMPRPHPISLMNSNRGILGLNLGHLWGEVDTLRPIGERLAELYATGTVKPVIAETFPFSAAAEAHRYIHGRRNVGKVLLTVET